MRTILALSLLAALSATAAVVLAAPPGDPPATTTPEATGFRDVADRVVEQTLPNGLKILVLPRHVSPTVSLVLMVKTGAVNEQTGSSGIAHLMEHMAFKGTHRIGTSDPEAEAKAMEKEEAAYLALRAEWDRGDAADPEHLGVLDAAFKTAQEEAAAFVVSNEYSTVYDRSGGVGLNAGTSADTTMYMVSLPSNRLEMWFALEGDRFGNPVFREFYKERDVVLEERRQRIESQPSGRLFEEALAAAFKAHPYGRPIIGYRSDLVHLSRTEGEDFYRRHYGPNNCTVAIVGDVDPEQVLAMANRYFGPIPRGPGVTPVTTLEPEQQGEKRVTVESEAQPLLGLAYHRPAASHPDDPVYDVMVDILGSGRSSRLHRALVKDQQLAVAIGAFTGFPGQLYPHLVAIYAVPAVGHTTDELETAIHAETARLCETLVSEAELQGVKTRVRAGLIRSLRSQMGLAGALAGTEVIGGNWRLLFESLDRIDAVSAEDVRRLAQQTFKKRNRTVATLVPPEAPGRNGGTGDQDAPSDGAEEE